MAVVNGKGLVIEDAGENLDSSIDSILSKQYFKEEGRTLIKFGSEKLDYHKDFKLFITTKLSNPHYLPEIFIKVTIINFTVTLEGLEDQLLADVVNIEKPEVEQKRVQNVIQLAQCKNQIAEIEIQILTLLKESKGLILDDEELIATLQESKKTSAIIKV